MEVGGLVGGIYRFCEWVMRFAYLNVLWILFSLLGLIVFGLAPATTAMYTVSRKWIKGEHNIPVFSTFWSAYRKEFVIANVLALIMLLIGMMLYVDIKLLQQMNSIIFHIISFILFGILLMYFAALLYLFPLYVHFKLKVYQYIQLSFLYAVSYPMQSILMIFCTIIVLVIVLAIPGLLPVLSAGPLSFILMWIAYRVFSKKEQQIHKSNNSLKKL